MRKIKAKAKDARITKLEAQVNELDQNLKELDCDEIANPEEITILTLQHHQNRYIIF